MVVVVVVVVVVLVVVIVVGVLVVVIVGLDVVEVVHGTAPSCSIMQSRFDIRPKKLFRICLVQSL